MAITKRVLKPVRVSGMVFNSFYVRERNLDERQIKYIKDHSMFMAPIDPEEKKQMNRAAQSMFEVFGSETPKGW